MNGRRIVLGGLVAGFVMVLGGFCLGHFVFGPEYVARFKQLFPQTPTRMLVTHVSMRIGFGLVAVFLYAAMLPRFRSRAVSTFVAGFVIWLLAYVPISIALHDLGLLVGRSLWIGLIWGLAETVAAAAAGAMLYRKR